MFKVIPRNLFQLLPLTIFFYFSNAWADEKTNKQDTDSFYQKGERSRDGIG